MHAHGEDVPDIDDRAKRFIFRKRLGEGAFGVVWEVFDCERNARVALKSLVRTDPNAIYRFKREFRALADIVHPNLVQLYELLSFSDRWFFTMEFVDGVDFVRHVSANADRAIYDRRTKSSGTVDPTTVPRIDAMPTRTSHDAAWYDQPTLQSDPATERTMPRIEVRQGPLSGPDAPLLFDADRLRSAMRQVAEGLVALHDARKLHRDIKPSNVLVTREGRVVVLDFGLVTELAPEGVAQSMNVVVGTPGFMSPEQAMGQPLAPSTDWYSVGVMLYLALTGRAPFDGPPTQMLMSQQRFEPVAPSVIAPAIPADLAELCVELLARDPARRPSGREIMDRLTPGVPSRSSSPGPRPSRMPFVGRELELGAMREAYAATQRGRAAVVFVHGGSGMGKSALIRRFLESVGDEDREAVVLAGRCYSRESVPYKAMDSLIDELSVYLRGLPEAQAQAVMPRGAWALSRLFPVLEQVECIAKLALRGAEIADPHELRRRAFGALRELLARLAERRPLVLSIDDLQWSDNDSNALLAEILRAPDPPALLLVACYRTDDLLAHPLPQVLSDPTGSPAHVHVRDLRVGEFGRQDAILLARSLLPPDEAARAEAIAGEAGGSPFFVEALARHAEASLGAADVREIDVREVIRARIAALPEGARDLFEVIVVASRPIDAGVARRAAGQGAQEPAMMAALLGAHLVRRSTGSGPKIVESYHDRIRETVLADLPVDARRRRHEALAEALEATEKADAEELAAHFQAAGRVVEATRYAAKAAAVAEGALAFDRAARLYELAFSLTPDLDAAVRVRLAHALANAGRGASAADAYLAAAEALPDHAIDLRRRAAEQLLLSGHVDRGVAAIKQVLDVLGMKLAESPKGALFSLVARRTRLWVRGLKYRETSAADVPHDELTRIDACWAVAVGLSLVDNIRGADYQARHLLLALQAGEPYRIARALSVEIAYSAAGGAKNQARTDELVAMTRALASRIGHPHALGLAVTMSGAAAFLAGDFPGGLRLAEQGASILRERCTGVAWELDTAEVFVLSCLHRLGRWKEQRARAAQVLRDAVTRGDLYIENQVRLDTAWNVDLAADAPDDAERHVEAAFAHSADRDFDTQHYLRLNAVANIRLYRGEAEAALELVTEGWPDLKRSFTLEIQMAHMDCLELRARAQIASAAREGPSADRRSAWLKAAAKDAARIESERLPWATAMATLARAGIESVRGDRGGALALASQAEEALRGLSMGVYAALARYRRGEAEGGAVGAALTAEATAQLAAEGVKSPARLAAMLAPGRFADLAVRA